MTQRLDYIELSNSLYRNYLAFSNGMKESAIDRKTRELINIRASQMNGCAFCVDMHIKIAKMLGETEMRLHHIAVWRESQLFSPRERACLEWTEALTHLSPQGVPDAIYNSVRSELPEKDISDLSFAVMAINGWNRINLALKLVPGSQDVLYGLKGVD